jgi:hypothetical protein
MRANGVPQHLRFDEVVMSSNTPLLILHLLGFAFGVGASTVLDIRMLRLLCGRPVNEQDLAFASVLSAFVRTGLLALWVSGLGFLLRAWYVAPELLANPKLHAKIVIVLVLTLNGILIEMLALRLLSRQSGRCLFDGVSAARQALVLSLGVVSATSWYAAGLLGIVRELNFGPSAAVILLGYGALLAAGIGMALAGRSALYQPQDDDASAARAHSALTPASRMTLPHFSLSRRTRSAKSSGELTIE